MAAKKSSDTENVSAVEETVKNETVPKEETTVEPTKNVSEPVLEAETEPSVEASKEEVNQFDFTQKKKGFPKFVIPIIILVVLGIIGGIGSLIYFQVTNNPTSIVKSAINDAYKDFSKSLKDLEKSSFEFNPLEDTIKISGDVEASGSMLEGLKNNKFNYTVGLDYKNRKAEVKASALEKGKDLIDGAIYFKDDRMYLESNTLFDNIYDIGEADFDDLFDLDDLEDVLDSYEIPSVDDIDYVVKEFKDALIASLDEEQMSQTDETLEINDITVKTKKITYDINKKSTRDLLGKFADEVLDNDDLIKKLASMTNLEKSDIKDAMKELKEKENYEDFEGSGEFSIYTTGLTHKVVGWEITFEDVKIQYSNYKDNAYFLVREKSSDMKLEVTSVKEKKEYDVRVILTVDGKKMELAKLTVRQFDEKAIDFDYEISYEDYTVKGSIKATTDKVSDKEQKGTIEFSTKANIDGEKFDLSVKLTYDIKINDAIADVNTSKALDEITEDDQEKAMKKLEDLENSSLYEFLNEFADLDDALEELIEPDESNGYSSPLDDTDCLEDYLDSVRAHGIDIDDIDYFSDYYDDYIDFYYSVCFYN